MAYPWNVGSPVGSYSSPASSFNFRAPPMVGNAGQQYQLGMMGDLAQAYQQAYEQGRRANEQRYGDIMRGRQQQYDSSMSMLQGAGAQSRQDIESRWRSAENQGIQDLTSRGLTGSTILPTMRMGYRRQAQADVGRLDESLRQQRLGLHTNLTEGMLGFMERREDESPDLGQLAALSQQVGQLAATSARRPAMPSYSASVAPPRPTAFSQFSMMSPMMGGYAAPSMRSQSPLFRSSYSMF